MVFKNRNGKKIRYFVTLISIVVMLFANNHLKASEVVLGINPIVSIEGEYRPVKDYLSQGEHFNVEITADKGGFMSLWMVDRTAKVSKIFPQNNLDVVLPREVYLASKESLVATGSSGYVRLVLLWTEKQSDQPRNVRELVNFERQSVSKPSSNKKLTDSYLAIYRESDNIYPPLKRTNIKAANSLRLTNPNPNGKVYILAMGANTDGLTRADDDAKHFGRTMSELFGNKFKPQIVPDTKRARFESEMGNLARKVRPNDVVIIYFSGHGKKLRKSRVEADGWDEAFQLLDGTISDKKFNVMLRKIRSKNVLVLLDACFAFGLYKNSSDAYGRLIKASSNSLGGEIHNENQSSSISRNKLVIVAASGENSAAREDPRSGGVFTTRITKALQNNSNAGKKLLTILNTTLSLNPQYASNPRFKAYRGSTLGQIVLKR